MRASGSFLPEGLGAAFVARLGDPELELPVLPDVAAEVLALVQSEASDASRLSALIHRDPALAGHVLRIANSAAYRPRAPIVSLQQAVTRLGVSALGEITLAVAVQGGVFRAAGHADLVRAMWQHSALAGAFAKEIARARRHNVESAFLCGLLHDVGRPVALNLLVDVAKKLGAPLTDAMIGSAITDVHTSVGALLAKRWKLPEVVTASIEFHHTPDAAPSASDSVRTTALADDLAHHALDPVEERESALRSSPIVKALNLYPDQLDALFAQRERALAFAGALA
jgi:putative nucleotidyltransferase with HDIG domain